MSQKCIVLMVDGISADHYINIRTQLPHLMQLEKRGFRVERLHAEQLGVSLSGRVSMLTGQTADQSGVYGNKCWDGEAQAAGHCHSRHNSPIRDCPSAQCDRAHTCLGE